ATLAPARPSTDRPAEWDAHGDGRDDASQVVADGRSGLALGVRDRLRHGPARPNGRGQRADRVGELFVSTVLEALPASMPADPPGGHRSARPDEPAERPRDHQARTPDRERADPPARPA